MGMLFNFQPFEKTESLKNSFYKGKKSDGAIGLSKKPLLHKQLSIIRFQN
jgi:hypothetical protein